MRQLIVFIKAPRPGFVKTRLALTLGAEAACGAYRQIVETVLERIAPLKQVCLCYAPADGAKEIRPWVKQGWSTEAQATGDLGERMHKAFVRAFARMEIEVVIIGSDSPGLRAEDIEEAWAALRSYEVVIGPAKDGGYWLIGLRQPQKFLFENMTWSTATVLSETLSRAQAAGLSVKMLRELEDIDTAADWEAFASIKGKAAQ